MSRILPMRIEDPELELRREDLIPILASPSQPENILRFSYALYRRRDRERLGTVRGQLRGEANRILSVECHMTSPTPDHHGYMSKAMQALETQIRRAGGPMPEARVEEWEDYEIYL